jgi:hypothetical protein
MVFPLADGLIEIVVDVAEDVIDDCRRVEICSFGHPIIVHLVANLRSFVQQFA